MLNLISYIEEWKQIIIKIYVFPFKRCSYTLNKNNSKLILSFLILQEAKKGRVE